MNMIILFELRKILWKKLSLFSISAVLLLSMLFIFSTYRNMYAFDGASSEGTGKTAVQIEKSLAAKYGGILTDEKVQQMMSDFKPNRDLHGMNVKYLYWNAIQSAAFARFSDNEGNWNGLSVADVFGEEEIKIGFISGWLDISRDFVRSMVILSIVIIIMVAPVFSSEYGGMDSIILTSKYGRTKCGTAKVAAGFISSLLVTVLVVGFNFALAALLFGLDGLDCSILFAPIGFTEGFIPFNITCGTLLKYQILLSFTSAVSVTGITLFVSALCKNQMAALVVAAAFQFLPLLLPVSETSPLFRLVVLLPIYHAQCFSLMSVQQLNGNLLYAIWAVPVAIVIMICGGIFSRNIFARHQVA
ncbi:MAG: ABC transporter permease [Clostridiales bacterium]|nr:ABC transporter permease [Clostridiales bacterium]